MCNNLKMEKENTEENKQEDGAKAEEKPEETMVDRADRLAKLLKTENDRSEKLLARAQFGGKSEGASEEKPKEDDPQEYAERALRGEIGNKQS